MPVCARKKSTCTALFKSINDLHKIVDYGNEALIRSFDMNKAFETGPHSILLGMLNSDSFLNTLLERSKQYLVVSDKSLFCKLGLKSDSTVIGWGATRFFIRANIFHIHN